ncbi:hypothetical protein [Deinococcus soli (ex Cha et al. 2016)]|uniref:hypothetical protein n=1 Tax=Deinococcus soli (ex Cha et al. 2016) TaxID=1309411 RepID=UPI0016643207|nr:hypothetical protein [Deinococcus soli (ex Cha et al. 2016)]GGB70451.1 hypothetical protein GCM10008019_28310 [Deinococcus soli (ex Cha et al. 2016)]
MFRRKPDPSAPDPLTQARAALDDAHRQQARLTAVAWSACQAAGRLDEAIQEAHATAPPERRPVLSALLALQLGVLCTLPTRHLSGEEIALDFQRIFGYPPQAFRDPGLAATHLLELRTHTAATYLLRLATGAPVTPGAVTEQGQADVNAIIHEERSARQRLAPGHA